MLILGSLIASFLIALTTVIENTYERDKLKRPECKEKRSTENVV